jgi:double-stranded uracil-DNA glycosylase
MSRVHSFRPIASAHAEMLILGTMPGTASLAAGEYYAHPRNQFWSILATLIGFDRDAPYRNRCERLVGHRIAVWDVLRSCQRAGSLDGSIAKDSIVVNDFAAFFVAHRRIHRVLFNGATAQSLYRRYAEAPARPIEYLRLPSTSPANASTPPAEKLSAWAAALSVDRSTIAADLTLR